ncbi:MAG TPA: M14 family zinc carboxypeptidase, partial [Saprospiraceae bacterium]|nr:M14 family zinc carboxypeptidase [Saprospiraceae bacterium]
MKKTLLFLIIFSMGFFAFGQDMINRFGPFDPSIPSPKDFFGFEVGEQMIRHDLIVAYYEKLAQVSENAQFSIYGRTYEGRKLVNLTISAAKNLKNIEEIRKNHLTFNDKYDDKLANEMPIIVNMGYSVHGNEPSAAESGILLAYTLLASKSPQIKKYLDEAIIFMDPMLNPDGRGRFEPWTNSYKSQILAADNDDVEHNEEWPRGRGNHYWFDLNRDWFLAIHPESRSKLKWYHQWYPNVIGDFHEMGTFSSFFFEPMKTNGSKNPIMPVENYTTLNDIFAKYFQKEMDGIGSLYFTKDVFDGT